MWGHSRFSLVSIPSSRVGTRGILPPPAFHHAVSIPSSRVGTRLKEMPEKCIVRFPSPQVGSGLCSLNSARNCIPRFHPLKSGRDAMKIRLSASVIAVSIPSSRVGTHLSRQKASDKSWFPSPQVGSGLTMSERNQCRFLFPSPQVGSGRRIGCARWASVTAFPSPQVGSGHSLYSNAFGTKQRFHPLKSGRDCTVTQSH